jgi:RNA polymerase sigma factor (sigma-70 family)
MSRILIVDDETPIAEALGMLFEREHFAVATAADREAAEQLLESGQFAVVLADVRLRTEEEGLMLLESIRRLSPRSKVATMTGYATPALEERLRALGARQIVYKPVEFDELLAIVRELLGDDETSVDDGELDLEALYGDLRKVLYSVPMRRFGLTGEDAEDVVQQGWCLFLEKRHLIQQPRAWLSGTVANLCRQRLEERRRMIASETSAFEDLADSRTRGADAALSIHAALAAADERTRQLCTLIALEELSYEEVSARLGIPLGSVGPLYMRAKTKLRRLLSAPRSSRPACSRA